MSNPYGLPGHFSPAPPPHAACTVTPAAGESWEGEVVAASPDDFYPVIRCLRTCGADGLVVGQVYLVRYDFLVFDGQ